MWNILFFGINQAWLWLKFTFLYVLNGLLLFSRKNMIHIFCDDFQFLSHLCVYFFAKETNRIDVLFVMLLYTHSTTPFTSSLIIVKYMFKRAFWPFWMHLCFHKKTILRNHVSPVVFYLLRNHIADMWFVNRFIE